MEQNSEHFRFNSDPDKEFVGLACPLGNQRPGRRHPSEVGGRLPRWLEYLSRKVQNICDAIDDVRLFIKRKRGR